jgi:hypothetical protein
MAQWIEATLPSNSEKTTALRKLLEAKDCAVRAVLFKEAAEKGPSEGPAVGMAIQGTASDVAPKGSPVPEEPPTAAALPPTAGFAVSGSQTLGGEVSNK